MPFCKRKAIYCINNIQGWAEAHAGHTNIVRPHTHPLRPNVKKQKINIIIIREYIKINPLV